MTTKLAFTAALFAAAFSISGSAFAQTAPTRPDGARTPPTVAEITARLQARGLTDAQIAERLAAIQAAIAAGERPMRPAGVDGQRPADAFGARPTRPAGGRPGTGG